MIQIVTDREVPGFMPNKIFMERIGKHVERTRILYMFHEIPDGFMEALNEDLL